MKDFFIAMLQAWIIMLVSILIVSSLILGGALIVGALTHG